MTERSAPHPIRRGRVTRTAPLLGLAGRTAGEAVVASLRGRLKGEDGAAFHQRTAERYADRLGRSKGVLMKAGQILSFVTLGPLVGDENQRIYQAALARLQDDALPMPAEQIAEVIEAELGAPPARLFAAFDPAPLAAASIGQVHAATLPDGRRVAVKVQYPGVERAIRADLDNTELLATFFQLMRGMAPGLTNLDVRALAREVSERIGEEIDYRSEAAYQTEFADAYRGHPFIHIPEVVPELSAERVLTMDLVEGMRWPEALSADASLRDLWGEAIFRFSIGSLRTLRLFNADPHPGNYLFHPDGRVSFLDFGCVKRFTREQLATMQAIISATVDGDAARLKEHSIAGGFVEAGDSPTPEALLDWYREALHSLTAPQPFTYTPEHAARVVQAEFSPNGPYREVVRKLRIQGDYTFLSRIDLGVTSVLGALGATGPWNAIREEWDCGGPPATALGELDFAFKAARA